MSAVRLTKSLSRLQFEVCMAYLIMKSCQLQESGELSECIERENWASIFITIFRMSAQSYDS